MSDNPHLDQANMESAKTNAFWLLEHLKETQISLEDMNYIELHKTNITHYMKHCGIKELQITHSISVRLDKTGLLFFENQ